VTIKNTGGMESDEVPQVYISAPENHVDIEEIGLLRACWPDAHLVIEESMKAD
jgi:hypothetical protein